MSQDAQEQQAPQISQHQHRQQQVRQARPNDTSFRSSLSFEGICVQAALENEEIVIAVRKFPLGRYHYLYDPEEISIAIARLQMRGYFVDSRTEMDRECSKIILTIEKDTFADRQVHGRVVK